MTMMDHVDLVDNDNSDRNDQILPFLVNVDSPQVLMRALKRSSDPCGKHALQYLLQQHNNNNNIMMLDNNNIEEGEGCYKNIVPQSRREDATR
jgi:hypothetical protein